MSLSLLGLRRDKAWMLPSEAVDKRDVLDESLPPPFATNPREQRLDFAAVRSRSLPLAHDLPLKT